MGWYGTNRHRRVDVIAALTKGTVSESGTQTQKTLAACYRGGMRSGVLYSVMERAEAGKEPIKFIAVHLLKYYRHDGWVYKPQDEDMGPSSDSCPLSYLEMAPEIRTEYSRAWRERVRNRAAARSLRRKGLTQA
jgi:hypothetical protein